MLNTRCMLVAAGAFAVMAGAVEAQQTRFQRLPAMQPSTPSGPAAAQAPAAPTAPALNAHHGGSGLYVGTDGWTVLHPSPDTRMIYVSSSTGRDDNNGLSEARPKRTLAAGFAALRDGHPDWLLLKSGDVWHESFPTWTRSGRSASERMVVRSYGSGPRPYLMTGSDTAVYINAGNGPGVRNLVFMDLHLNAHTNPGTAAATGFMLFNNVHDVLIENCYTENYRVNMIFQAFTPGIRASNIDVRRNVIVDALATNHAHAQGIFADGVDDLLMEENIFDMNGWSPTTPTANIFRHNVYIQTNIDGEAGCTGVVARGNITARASATGLMLRTGGINEDNLYLENPIGLQFGQTSGPASSGVVRNNVFLDARDISPTVQRGRGMNISYSDGVEVSGNIIAHQRSATENVQAIGIDGTYRDLTLRDNIVYDWNIPGGWQGRSLAFFGTPLRDIQIIDNQFIQPRGGYMAGHYASLGPAFTYAGNSYFSSNSGTHEFFANMTFDQWVAQSGESNPAWGLPAYASPERDIAAYMTQLGRPASVDAFMNEARQQSRHNWRPEFTAAHVNQWVREGFGAELPPPPPAPEPGPAPVPPPPPLPPAPPAPPSGCALDLNGDGRLDVLDVLTFIDMFAAEDPRADINGDGVLNILDLIEFQRRLSIGCD